MKSYHTHKSHHPERLHGAKREFQRLQQRQGHHTAAPLGEAPPAAWVHDTGDPAALHSLERGQLSVPAETDLHDQALSGRAKHKLVLFFAATNELDVAGVDPHVPHTLVRGIRASSPSLSESVS